MTIAQAMQSPLPTRTARRRTWATVAVLYVLFMVVVIAVADTGVGASLFSVVGSIPNGDKLGHLVLIGTLAFVVNAAWRAPEIRIGNLYFLRGSLVVSAVVLLEETSQIWLPRRTFDGIDLTADAIGILLAGVVVRRLWPRERGASGASVALSYEERTRERLHRSHEREPRRLQPRDGSSFYTRHSD